MSSIKCHYKFDTEYSADSVEFCPLPNFQNIFACANYQLKESEEDSKPCERLGRILLFSLTKTDGLVLLQTIETAAVLDQKWNHNLLGVVNAKKSIEIYELNNKKQLELVIKYTINDEDNQDRLLLSLDWSKQNDQNDNSEIVVSDSRGDIHLFNYHNSGELELIKTWQKSHNFEAWISSFHHWDSNVFFSGGDDSVLIKYDRRVDLPILRNSKEHSAGVTAIQTNANREYSLTTGSYDELLRMWDLRTMKFPIKSIKMPGPIWRLKWDPFNYERVLVACMLGGVCVVDVRGTNSTDVEIVEHFVEHKSIAYGADWCFLTREECSIFGNNRIIGSCSFYDHLLCISTLN